MAKILIIEDDVSLAENVFLHLKAEGQYVLKVHSIQEGLVQMERNQPDIILTDLILGDGSGIEVLRASRMQKNIPDVILVTGHPTSETATLAMQGGAYEYLSKPYELSELSAIVQRILKRRALVSTSARVQQRTLQESQPRNLIIENPGMKHLLNILRHAAPRNTTVLLLGESGTGKEEFARFIHENGPNPEGPFIAINCGAIPENLVASELFGHEKGSFTGATDAHSGAFVRANNGTLLLDEIGDIPQTIQVHLLRLLENREVTPIGGIQPIPVNVRLLAATHRNLEKLIFDGKFREDLFFRLNVFPMNIPPLRERIDEIPKLVHLFLKELGMAENAIGEDAIRFMQRYHWPGNVRELKNIVENLSIRSGNTLISLALVKSVLEPLILRESAEPKVPTGDETLAEIEMREIREALERVGGNKSKAARLLGVSRTKLYSRIKMLGLDEE